MRGQVERDGDGARGDGTEGAGTPCPPVDGSQWLLRVGCVMAAAAAMIGMPMPALIVITRGLRGSVGVDRDIGTGHRSSSIRCLAGPGSVAG